MSKPVSRIKIKNFHKRIEEVLTQEMELRAQIKRDYAQFVLDVGDDKMALRQVRLAYFQAQKLRINKLLAERMEFHPFFGMSLLSSAGFTEENLEDLEEEDNDGPF